MSSGNGFVAGFIIGGLTVGGIGLLSYFGYNWFYPAEVVTTTIIPPVNPDVIVDSDFGVIAYGVAPSYNPILDYPVLLPDIFTQDMIFSGVINNVI